MPKKKNIIIFVNEFFGAWNTARGGYGFIARKLLPKLLSEHHICFCLGRSKSWFTKSTLTTEDGFSLIKLPKSRFLASRIVNSFDIAISIEATVDYLFTLKNFLRTPVIFWIQDPRTKQDWIEIDTVTLAKEPCYWNSKTYELVRQFNQTNKIEFVTQAYFLIPKAIELYSLPEDKHIAFLPNPIDLPPFNDFLLSSKSNSIIFLGRIDSVKRGWLFCEIAKRLPQYEFYLLGASTNSQEQKNNSIVTEYCKLHNIHFLGHVDGKKKHFYLSKAKILVNTSIHEALPISFLEAFAYGITIVSNQNPDNLTQKYGRYIGQSLGDGWAEVNLFVKEIDYLLSNDSIRIKLAKNAREYVETTHSFKNSKKILDNILDNIT